MESQPHKFGGNSLCQIKNPLHTSERVCELVGEILCGAYDVARLEALRAFQQIELDGLTFIQRAVAVLLDGREMHEHILAGGALDESVSLRPVEPLHSTLLSHKETPFTWSKNYSSVSFLFAPICWTSVLPDIRYKALSQSEGKNLAGIAAREQ